MQRIIDAVEKHRDAVLEAFQYISSHPETGYKEFETSKYLSKKFEELGYHLNYAEGITGFTTEIDTKREGPTLLIMAELDSVICPTHPCSDAKTGAVHACGHNAQCAALLGIAAALTEPGMLDGLSGKIRLCAVPAEELLEIEFRKSLRAEGKIRYMGGKTEFLARGMFDGVDLAFLFHTALKSCVDGGAIGCLVKKITFKGRAAHAGGSPWLGCNALYAANCGINAINAIRETFHDRDLIRVHPIITHGGDAANTIPDCVSLESYVRGRTFEAITETNAKVNRALAGAALSIGANVDIEDISGYAPLYNSESMIRACRDAFAQIMPQYELLENPISTGSTDMGDLSCIMPVIHPRIGGAAGMGHGSNFRIENTDTACIGSAKWQLATCRLLLENGAERAKRAIAEFKPRFATAKDYLDYLDSLNKSGEVIEYREDGTALVKLI